MGFALFNSLGLLGKKICDAIQKGVGKGGEWENAAKRQFMWSPTLPIDGKKNLAGSKTTKKNANKMDQTYFQTPRQPGVQPPPGHPVFPRRADFFKVIILRSFGPSEPSAPKKFSLRGWWGKPPDTIVTRMDESIGTGGGCRLETQLLAGLGRVVVTVVHRWRGVDNAGDGPGSGRESPGK